MADNGIAIVEKREGLNTKYYFSREGAKKHLVLVVVLQEMLLCGECSN